MTEGLREKLEEILAENCNYCGRGLECRYCPETADAIIAVFRESLPEWKPAHTYASENADEYRAYDAGFKDCLDAILSRLRGEEK